MVGRLHLVARAPISPPLPQPGQTLEFQKWVSVLEWLTGRRGKRVEEEGFGTSQWRRTRPAPPQQVPLGLEVETERGFWDQNEENEAKEAVEVGAAVEAVVEVVVEECQPSQPTAIYRPSWAT